MATCKRCGQTFIYEKTDGVCPKCCFYNRPVGSTQSDESWMKNYNCDDNSYVPPKISSEEIMTEKKGRITVSDITEYGLHKKTKGKSVFNRKIQKKPTNRKTAKKDDDMISFFVVLILIIVVILFFV